MSSPKIFIVLVLATTLWIALSMLLSGCQTVQCPKEGTCTVHMQRGGQTTQTEADVGAI